MRGFFIIAFDAFFHYRVTDLSVLTYVEVTYHISKIITTSSGSVLNKKGGGDSLINV